MKRIVFVTMVFLVLTATSAWCGQLEDRIIALEQQVALLESKVAAIEGNTALQLDGLVRVDNSTINNLVGPHVIFEGANVHIRSGQGFTWHWDKVAHPPNGLGNLIIGYNENSSRDRSGSHNLVVGEGHSYPGFASLLTGMSNYAADYSALIGGDTNSASSWSAVVGGYHNTVDNQDYSSVIVGGYLNTVKDVGGGIAGYSLILGGNNNQIGLGYENVLIGGSYSSVTGGHNVLTGGNQNSVNGNSSLLLGGTNEVSSGTLDTLIDKNFHTNP